MRIAQITQSYPPMVSGAALVVQRLSEKMVERGHSLLVLAASDRGQPYTAEEAGVKVVRLKSWTNRVRVQQTFVLGARQQIHSELSRFQPDLIHTHEPLFMGVPALFYGNRNQIPVICTTHALPRAVSNTIKGLRPLKSLIEITCWLYAKWYLNRCWLAIVPSQTIAEEFDARVGCPTVVISSGVDMQVFKPEPDFVGEQQALCQRFGLLPDLPVILHAGRLDADKSVDVVINAAIGVLNKTPAQVLIVGDGTRRPHLIRQAQASGLGEWFHFPGFVTKDTFLPGLYRLGDVFVTASEIETQGIVLLEAAASGLPLVAVRATCIHEIVHAGENGYLVPSQDAERLAECILQVLRNKKKAGQMGAASRHLAAQHSMEKTIKKYETLCRRLTKMDAGHAFLTKVSQQ